MGFATILQNHALLSTSECEGLIKVLTIWNCSLLLHVKEACEQARQAGRQAAAPEGVRLGPSGLGVNLVEERGKDAPRLDQLLRANEEGLVASILFYYTHRDGRTCVDMGQKE